MESTDLLWGSIERSESQSRDRVKYVDFQNEIAKRKAIRKLKAEDDR